MRAVRVAHLLLLLGLSSPNATELQAVDRLEVDRLTLQEQVESAAAGSPIPGLVVALREPDGRELVTSVGVADLEAGIPMRTDTLFYVGTISQSMLAVVIFMLLEEGRLELTDPVSEFIECPGAEEVTIEMLMDHSSGFADWAGGDLAARGNPRLPRLLRTPQTPEGLLAVAAAGEPAFPPGERQEASYTNMLLLAKLIETVEGKPARVVLEKRIFKPLGLSGTRYLAAEDRPASLARGYRQEAGWGELLPGGLTEAGWADRSLEGLADMGIVSTATDVLRYHAGLREGRLIPRPLFERMRTVRSGKINGLGYLVMSGARGTWEGNTGHAVGHLGINLFHTDKGFYMVVLGNLGDVGLPVAQIFDARYGRPEEVPND
jgi:D-alanyl-D-alanine carboxypeptidase